MERGDLPWCLDTARALAKRFYPDLLVDVKKLSDALHEAYRNPRHFAVVVEKDEALRGMMVAFASDNLWAQRSNANVSVWYSDLPGAGAQMLRAFREWVKPQRSIRFAGLFVDTQVDPRALVLAERIGFKRQGGAFILYN